MVFLSIARVRELICKRELQTGEQTRISCRNATVRGDQCPAGLRCVAQLGPGAEAAEGADALRSS